MNIFVEIAIVVVRLVVNGWFAMSELAVVSSRRARLEALAAQGSAGARAALQLAENPSRFISATQIGITLVGILAGAYSGATLADPVAAFLLEKGVPDGWAHPLSIALVVGTITYLSLIVGELVPKQVALSDPERVAAFVARPMMLVAAASSPVVSVLDACLAGRAVDVEAAMRPIEVVPDTAPALSVLEVLRRSPIHMVVVMDEYGSVEGIVTATDILGAIVGELAEEGDEGGEAAIVRRDDGSWLVDGDLPVGLVADRVGCRALDDPDRDYETLAGFVLSESKAIPSTGDVLAWRGWRFEVVDMDGRRIDKVLVTAPDGEPAAG